MPAPSRPRVVLLALFALLGVAVGCATTEEGTRDAAAIADEGAPGLVLSRASDLARTVQLYRSGNEGSLPVLPLGSGQTLTLEFDVLGEIGDTYSVYFYHADRQWRRDLLPVEYLQTFQSDDIRDYELSLATEVRYSHYEYEFPNQNIQFLRSGNYVLRVTEAGDERAVLFEQPFFITEQSAEIDFAVRSGLGSGSYFQPVARIRPPDAFDSPVYDFNVCFARNGRFALARCADDPTLVGGSLFEFLLPRETAFTHEGPLYELDLGTLQPGPQIVDVDLQTSPYTVTLDLDYARFGGDLFDGDLTGQTLVSTVVQDAPGPADIGAEYVTARFRFVPQNEEPSPGPVILTGSFNGWVVDPAYELAWDAAEARYETEVLLKQGRYVYKYVVDDPAERERIRRTAGLGQPNLYTAFVYLYDPQFDTDRLLAVNSVLGQ
jgi:hypothetical protein